MISSLKGAEIKMRKIKVLRYYKARVYTSPNKDPILNKSAESKYPNYLLQGFGANTLYLKKEIKVNAKRN